MTSLNVSVIWEFCSIFIQYSYKKNLTMTHYCDLIMGRFPMNIKDGISYSMFMQIYPMPPSLNTDICKKWPLMFQKLLQFLNMTIKKIWKILPWRKKKDWEWSSNHRVCSFLLALEQKIMFVQSIKPFRYIC